MKHAYLILAHKDDTTFRTLIKMLDYKENDIFIHMDLKNKGYKPDVIEKMIKYSNIYHIKRKKVSWGGYSFVDAEIRLLEAATNNGEYEYYHLISGEDLPIKTQAYIHNFFHSNSGHEFIRFERENFQYEYRIKYYYWLQNLLGRNENKIGSILRKISINLQKICKINRNKDIKFQKGTNWFSITDGFARYVVQKKEWIKKVFKYTYIGDEIFMQTIIISSKFKNNLYWKKFDNNTQAIMRLIDWNRGNPYVFTIDDYEEIKNSNMLFARKFQANVDEEIILRIYEDFKL